MLIADHTHLSVNPKTKKEIKQIFFSDEVNDVLLNSTKMIQNLQLRDQEKIFKQKSELTMPKFFVILVVELNKLLNI